MAEDSSLARDRRPAASRPGAGPPTPPCLTADLVARAIIAAAAVYGADPVRAMTALRGPRRSCLTPACKGIADATGRSFKSVARIVGIREQNYSRAASRPDVHFAKAVRAAERAASYAAWRPEGRESIVAGAGNDAVELPQPVMTARLAPKNRPAPAIPARPRAAAAPIVPEAAPEREPAAGLSDEDRTHLRAIYAANNGRGFPAPKAAHG